jgi:hypothetical protein
MSYISTEGPVRVRVWSSSVALAPPGALGACDSLPISSLAAILAPPTSGLEARSAVVAEPDQCSSS